MFVASQPVPLYSSRSAAADADREAALDAPPTSRVQHAANSTARERVEAVINSVNAGPELSDAAAPPAPPTDIYTAGCCNVVVLDGLLSGCPMHIDGDLLSYGFRCGYKLRDPGVGGAVLRLHAGDGAVEAVKHKTYEHGLYDSVEAVCSDAGEAGCDVMQRVAVRVCHVWEQQSMLAVWAASGAFRHVRQHVRQQEGCLLSKMRWCAFIRPSEHSASIQTNLCCLLNFLCCPGRQRPGVVCR